MKHLLLSVFFICLTTSFTYAQKVQVKKQFTNKQSSSKRQVSDYTAGEFLIQSPKKSLSYDLTFRYEDLPDKIVFIKGDEKIEFTRKQIWEWVEYCSYLMPHIDRSWANDEEEKGKK